MFCSIAPGVGSRSMNPPEAVAARRRRRLLVGVAAFAFAAGVLIGAGHGGNGKRSGGAAANRDRETQAAAADAPTVSDFHRPVPILMYHSISPAPPGAALPKLFVPEVEFEAQMKWLRDHGYNGVTLGQVSRPGRKASRSPATRW
jgi:hypothetical protein